MCIRTDPAGDTLALMTDVLVEIHTDDGVTGRTEFERRLAACAGLPPAAVIDIWHW
jgi:hypothetical protein